MLLHANGLTAEEEERYLEIVLSEVEACRDWLPRRWGQLGHDALDDAVSHVWMKIRAGRYDPAVGEFRPWCRQVLRRLVLVHGRRALRLARRGLRAAGQTGDDQRGVPLRPAAGEDFDTVIRGRELARFSTARFSREDLRRVCSWTPWDRVVLLALAGLWNKLPPRIWTQWWTDVASRRELGASPPPAMLAERGTPQRRLPILAAALQVKANTLAARWMRNKHLLAELDCIQDLGMTPAELVKRQPRRPQCVAAAC